MTTAEKIKYNIMERYDIKQKDVANVVGLTEGAVSQWFSGATEPKLGRLQKLANHFGLELSDLIGDEFSTSKNSQTHKDSSEYVVFPVMGEIAAGYDKIAIEDWDGETIPIHISNLKGRSKDNFLVLEVRGNSMFPEFQNGDKVLIQKQDSLDYSGQIGAIIYNNDCATLKKIEYKEGEYWLKLVPINPNFETEKIEGEGLEYCKVIGVPKLLIREYEQ